jgi:hypothetical protein
MSRWAARGSWNNHVRAHLGMQRWMVRCSPLPRKGVNVHHPLGEVQSESGGADIALALLVGPAAVLLSTAVLLGLRISAGTVGIHRRSTSPI